MKISFCLITLNEESNLARCLQSCAGLADEFVVLDSGSQDRTREIAANYGARWHHQPWLGYVAQKNKVLSLARNEWVFSIDADEELSSRLQAEIREIIQKGEISSHVSGFSMPRCVLYEGRWIRHGDWYPDRLTRLFRRDQAHFSGGKVHERLEIQGSLVPLQGELHHYSFKDSLDHWERCKHYAQLWAETQFELGRRVSIWEPQAHAAFRWFRGYVLKAGFLDGRQGWRIARMNAKEVALKYRLLRQMLVQTNTPRA